MSSLVVKKADTLATGDRYQNLANKVLYEHRDGFQIDYYLTKDEQQNIGESKNGIECKGDQRMTTCVNDRGVTQPPTFRMSLEIYKGNTANMHIASTWSARYNTHTLIQISDHIMFTFRKERLFDYVFVGDDKKTTSYSSGVRDGEYLFLAKKYIPFEEIKDVASDIIVMDPKEVPPHRLGVKSYAELPWMSRADYEETFPNKDYGLAKNKLYTGSY